ncbi:MAG TPA: transposase [Pirellulales bacterium]
MNGELLLPFHLFDDEAEVSIVERRLPHWSQPGTIVFITFRAADSMPSAVLDEWFGERAQWLRKQGIDPQAVNWRDHLKRIDPQLVRAFHDRFWNRWHDALDAGHGACALRDADCATIVSKSLHHFDGQRYVLLDFVVMPNHVHLLAAFADEDAMLAQCESWKHYTATQINRHLRRKGRFWEQDAYDHLVRSDDQFAYLRRYIAENPRKAHLGPGQFQHYSRRLTMPSGKAMF